MISDASLVPPYSETGAAVENVSAMPRFEQPAGDERVSSRANRIPLGVSGIALRASIE
jgi:hypothetical protein